MMKTDAASSHSISRQLAFVLLASALALPTLAQQGKTAVTSGDNATPQTESTAEPLSAPPAAVVQPSSINAPKEGFWGRVNPFARKKWVNNRVNPIKGQLNELDEVNARNSRDIQDVDRRSQAGIRRAQSAADAANQTAALAGDQARNAGSLAQGASARVDRLNSTVTGLDKYSQTNELEVRFHGGQPILTAVARKQLDEFAGSISGRQGYVLEIEGHSPQAGAVGIQNSGRLADAVKRYLVTKNEIPVYRMHSVALGNAPAAGEEDARPARTNSVHIRLMENSLAAREVASPNEAASSTGAERP
jgi:outer membrane protein OmpA-like peptidoglycan-associated protein